MMYTFNWMNCSLIRLPFLVLDPEEYICMLQGIVYVYVCVCVSFACSSIGACPCACMLLYTYVHACVLPRV